MTQGIFERLAEAGRQRRSLLCIGLDPRVDPDTPRPGTAIADANARLIEQTADFALAYKPNIAFYERFGADGLRALKRTVDLIPEDVFVILDAKRGDIGSTAQQYAAAAFETFGADLVTVSPYLGRDSIDPFLDYADRGVFVLCRTSNPSAGELQDLSVLGETGGPELLYMRVAATILSWGPSAGLVVAGNDIDALRRLRTAFPDAWFLAPGIGAQGGTVADAVAAGADLHGSGILPVVARAIANAASPAEAAERLRDEIGEAVSSVDVSGASAFGHRAPADTEDLRDTIISGLFREGCFQIGEFTLKSGRTSPFYVDLRRAVASPSFMRAIAAAYARLAEGIAFDRIAGIPVAALPIATALSLAIDRPLIYPRIPPKAHGSGRPVEGAYNDGERVLLIDDLITTGGSKIEAAAVLESEGLRVDHLVVLLERGRQGREELEARGITLHAFLQIEELLTRGRELGLVSREDEAVVLEYLAE